MFWGKELLGLKESGPIHQMLVVNMQLEITWRHSYAVKEASFHFK